MTHFQWHQKREFFACLEVWSSFYTVQYLSFCLFLHTFWWSTYGEQWMLAPTLSAVSSRSRRPLHTVAAQGEHADSTLACTASWGALADQPLWLTSTEPSPPPLLPLNISSKSWGIWQHAGICWDPEQSGGFHMNTTGIWNSSIWKQEGSRVPLAESHA